MLRGGWGDDGVCAFVYTMEMIVNECVCACVEYSVVNIRRSHDQLVGFGLLMICMIWNTNSL